MTVAKKQAVTRCGNVLVYEIGRVDSVYY